MSKSIKSLIILALSLPLIAIAAGNGALQKVTKKYRSAKLVEMSVEKIVKSDLLGKETKYQGQIFLADKKFRWENTTPEKTLLVFDGQTIWSEQTPPKEFGGAVQVAKGKVDKKTGTHILVSSLLSADLEAHFKVLKEEKLDGPLVRLDVEPKGGDLNIQALKVVLDTKNSQMKELSYMDEIGNLTTMKFSNVKFSKKAKDSLFKYQPPKGAQVTDL